MNWDRHPLGEFTKMSGGRRRWDEQAAPTAEKERDPTACSAGRQGPGGWDRDPRAGHEAKSAPQQPTSTCLFLQLPCFYGDTGFPLTVLISTFPFKINLSGNGESIQGKTCVITQVTLRYGKNHEDGARMAEDRSTAVAKGLLSTGIPRAGRDLRADVPSSAGLAPASDRAASHGTALKLPSRPNPAWQRQPTHQTPEWSDESFRTQCASEKGLPRPRRQSSALTGEGQPRAAVLGSAA